MDADTRIETRNTVLEHDDVPKDSKLLQAAVDRILDAYRGLDVNQLAKHFQNDAVEVVDLDYGGKVLTIEVFGFWDSHKKNHFRVVASANDSGRCGRDITRDFIRSPEGFVDEDE